MKITDRVKNAFNGFMQVQTNSSSLRDARNFLKYGNGSMMTPDWSQVLISDQDTYTGFMYGAINIRAVTVASLAENNLNTKVSPTATQQFKDKGEAPFHPYLSVIDESKTFSNFEFWYDNSVYLDLEGISYILAIRNISTNGKITGSVQEFKILNPYRVRRIFDAKTQELLGYKEYKGGMSRDIPKEMIIPVVNLNPFNHEELFSMSDAAKDSQFTIKTANDYTRSAIRNNLNTPGIISTDAQLGVEEAANFKSRVMATTKGEPLFGFGAGKMDWNDMQTDLNKAALKDVNSMSLQTIVAASGASKTMLGWEESGTTRDTARVQKDNFIELRAMPQIQNIIDALNQDYKNYYETEYKKFGYKIVVENPLGVDLEERQKEIENLGSSFELYESLVSKGYDREEAAKYVIGEIELVDMTEPEKPDPVIPPTEEPEEPEEKEEPKEEQNKLNPFYQQAESGLLNQTQASLQNTITNIDNRLLMTVANRVGEVKNEFDSESELITETERKALRNELETALAAFFTIIVPLYAYNTMSKRLEQSGIMAQFRVNNDVRKFVKTVANKASLSHIDTLLKEMMNYAQKEALAGASKEAISRGLLNKFGDEIAKTRAVAIARTETNRAFTMSQYLADKQFLKQADLEKQAYKQWSTRSDNPCPFCQAMAANPPIPFNQAFAEIGDELTATAEQDGKPVVRKMTVSFLNAEAGNLHVNCGCEYILVDENGNELF